MPVDHPELLKISSPIRCKVLGRINKFKVKIQLDGEVEYAHINNTGRLQEYLVKGREGFCIRLEKPRKTKYRLFSIAMDDYGALIDTWIQEKAFERSLDLKLIPWLKDCRIIKRNVKLNNSIIDYRVRCGAEEIYLELKSAVQRIDGYASYPDAPSIRARRQLRDLIRYVEGGGKAMIIFIVGLRDVEGFTPNKSIDPEIHQLLLKGLLAGLKIKAIGIYYDPNESSIKLWSSNIKVTL
ncbi:MAG TPA: DNA/RNA nuclease SfsA [Nitrososphaeria archaeon]|nr:MAG: DNA/RNA nuclease SfsA [Nitrososphaerota archaeon]HDJ66158.1 DNA/RNA nuclease SfsA [Nitrososphaeria archaeon]